MTRMVTAEDIICPPPAPQERFEPRGAFGRDGPFELEIGCGKGGFLLRRARERPEVNLLGIEWANKYFRFAADRMARWGLENVRVMRADARHFVMHHLSPGCLAALHVYHPDPWPKKRHHKRRLFQKAFVAAAVQALAPDGRWAIQTDHAEYFEWIKAMLSDADGLRGVDFEDPAFGVVDDAMQTNFEIKYRREGRSFHRLAFRKIR